jgi:tetratricopeptide (TPR) repeat protein
MKHGSAHITHLLRLAILAGSLSLTAVHADDYADVNQLMRTGKLAEAQAKVDQYLATKPRDPQMRFFKGVIQRETGKTNDAIATFTRLTEDYPELPEPYNNLAVLYAGQGQYDKARAALEMAIRTNPSYSTAHENLGDVYAKLASQAYNKALQLDGNSTTAQPKLALIRELFDPNAKGQRPGAQPTPAPAAPAAPATPAATPGKPPVVAAAPSAAPASPSPAAPSAAADNAAKDVEAAVRAWAKAWAAKDMTAYLGAYGKEFTPPGKQSRSSWENERRQRIVSKNNISLRLENLSVSVNGNKAVAKFRQDYKADALSVTSRKTLDLVKNGERWLIVRESTGT